LLETKELLIPNRVEKFQGQDICVDMFAMPGWLAAKKLAQSTPIQSPRNTHSAFLLFSAEKFKIAYSNRLSLVPTPLNGLGLLESALANLLNELTVYRAVPTDTEITIVHLDSWLSSGLLRGDFTSVEIQNFRAD
jgi:hypothetical protein